MIKGGNAPGLAAAHCAKYGATARVTFEPSQAGGDVVFVCDTPATAGPLPADKGAPGRQPPPPPQKQSPRSG
jgi:hypothetical protein